MRLCNTWTNLRFLGEVLARTPYHRGLWLGGGTFPIHYRLFDLDVALPLSYTAYDKSFEYPHCSLCACDSACGGAPSQVLQDLTRETAAAEDALAPRLGAAAGGPAELLPRLQEVLRQSALTLNELLRHFWACFRSPVVSRARLDKLERIQQGLVQQYDKCALVAWIRA